MNTKRVIQYFATIAASGEKKKEEQSGKMQVSSYDGQTKNSVFNCYLDQINTVNEQLLSCRERLRIKSSAPTHYWRPLEMPRL